MDTGKGSSHTEVCCGGLGEIQQWVGRLGRDNMGRNVDIGDGGMEAANHIDIYVLCATILHILHMHPRI